MNEEDIWKKFYQYYALEWALSRGYLHGYHYIILTAQTSRNCGNNIRRLYFWKLYDG